ncbi:hypothetical protein KI659_17630 [Litoribacter alkaliphilus]|uniref:DUF6575 domain-containing protein n=1 Tax=Litoribacter ruber TaxID=702568 RepID=A0AAP2G6A1_9BACT|nr:DUF6575 domain-containing protein [Litoribacter alkaliphilus]MBS9525846.1 hypothetical protein [Litoribacter alkaliphilus]
MRIDEKYRLQELPLSLTVVDAFDFREEPILLLEKDVIGNSYLSYLVESKGDTEQRIILQVSNDRLSSIFEKEISIRNAFSNPENKFIYIAEFSLTEGEPISAYLMPGNIFSLINPVDEEYNVDINYALNQPMLNEFEILSYSERKQKLIFDFYLQSQNLINSVKPFAIYKVLTPIVEIIKSLLSFDNRNADRFLAFSNIRQGSLGVTIEINYSNDLFLEKETEVMETIIQLLNAQKKSDFETLISKTTNERYIKEYTTIIKAIIENNANLHTAYANPVTKRILTSVLDKERATKAKEIIDETLDTIEDIENIIGIFLEIDIDSREPSFKIHSNEEDVTVKGKFELSILDKVKNDYVNMGKETYTFTIKTIYKPETTLRAEEIKRFMINYEKYGS